MASERAGGWAGVDVQMTHTITVTRCMDCPLYAQEDPDDCTPNMCLHKDSGWDNLEAYGDHGIEPPLVYPQPSGIPDNCPLLQAPVTYRAERKS